MNEWKTVRLGDIFDLQMGKTPDRKNLDFFSTTDNKWISIADISKANKYITETKEYISDEAVKKSGIKQIPSNTVIMSFKLSIGKTAITKEPMYSNEAIMAFLSNGKYEVDNDFLYHLFSNKDWSEGSNKAVKGITLNKASLLEATIPLPPLAEQKHIAAILDKTQKIIAEHKQMLQKYDTLIKSRFIEMFGDPVTNTMAWEVRKLNELFEIIDGDRGKNYPKADELFDTEGYCLFLNAGNVTKTGFVFDNCQFITKEKDEILRKGKLKRKDIIVTTRGTVGNIAEYSDNITFKNMRINSGMVILRKIKEMNSTFFIYYFRNPAIYGRLISGTAQPQMPINNMKNCNVIVPPLTLQNDFAAFVQQIDKSKFAVQKSLKKTETLYKSLMQQYFA